MKIQFIGVGEGFEPSLGNTSILVSGSKQILVDVGYAVPRNFIEARHSSELVDAIYLTHFHADHTFGLPPLLYRWHDEGRKKSLLLFGKKGTEKFVKELIEIAYPQTIHKLGYPLEFEEVDSFFRYGSMVIKLAKTAHQMENHAISIEEGNYVVGISGDGEPTEASKELYEDCTLLIHEAFRFDQETKGHTTAVELLRLATGLPRLRQLVFIHIHRLDRDKVVNWLAKQKVPFQLIVPKPFDMIELGG